MSQMIFRTGDPLADFAAWDFENAMDLERYPCCDVCGEPVTDEIFEINGEKLCIECLRNMYATNAEYYAEGGRDETEDY